MMKYATNIGLIYEIRNNPVQKLSCQIPNWQRLIFLYIKKPASYTLEIRFLYLAILPLIPRKFIPPHPAWKIIWPDTFNTQYHAYTAR